MVLKSLFHRTHTTTGCPSIDAAISRLFVVDGDYAADAFAAMNIVWAPKDAEVRNSLLATLALG